MALETIKTDTKIETKLNFLVILPADYTEKSHHFLVLKIIAPTRATDLIHTIRDFILIETFLHKKFLMSQIPAI